MYTTPEPLHLNTIEEKKRKKDNHDKHNFKF